MRARGREGGKRGEKRYSNGKEEEQVVYVRQ